MLEGILFTGYLIILSSLIQKWSFLKDERIPKYWLLSAFGLKVLAGFLLAWIYTHIYTDQSSGDTWKYFYDANFIRQEWNGDRDLFWRFLFGLPLNETQTEYLFEQLHGFKNPYTYGLSNDSPTIVRINLIISFFSFGFYSIHILFMSFLSLIGLKGIFNLFATLFSDRKKGIFIACFLLPSVVFWGSGVLKEAPLLLALGLLWHFVFVLYKSPYKLLYWIGAAACIWTMIFLKEYVIISLVPALLFLAIDKLNCSKKSMISFLAVHLICGLIAFNAGVFNEAGSFLYIMSKKQTDFYNVVATTNAGSAIYIAPITDTWHLLLHYPQAFVLTYFRPSLLDANGLLLLTTAFENLIYLLLFITATFSWRKPTKPQSIWVLAALSFVLIIALIVGNTVPVLGAVVRYRIVALPFFSILAYTFISEKKIPKLARFLQ